MITVTTEAGVGIVAVVAAASIGWAVSLSSRSAVSGPAWAHARLGVAVNVLLALLGVAAVSWALVTPRWVPLAVAYALAATWFVARTLRANLGRLAAMGGFEDLDEERRTAIVLRARRWAYLAGGGIALVGALLVSFNRIAGWASFLIGCLVWVNGWALRPGRSATPAGPPGG